MARAHERRERIRRRVRLVPEQNLRAVLSRGLRTLAARSGPESLGDYLEFGVYNGTSLTCMYRELVALDLHHVRLFGFDSFQGFPPYAANEDDGRWQPGRCYSPLSFTTAVLETEGVDFRRLTLVPGWFSDTLNAATVRTHRITKASVIMIDCDMYSSAKEALNFCAPLIGNEALVLFDEWNITRLPGKMLGEKKAFHEFLEEHACFSAVPFAQYAERSQAFLISRTR
jgi:O-methyltransferase